MGRLASAAETAAWSQTYGYDAFGNQWVADGSGFAQGSAPTLFTAGGAGSYDQSNHLTIQSAAYDGVGNQKAIGGYQYVYDGENRMVQSLLNAPVAYLYDGSGNRVAKVDCATGTPQCTPATGVTTTWYIYDAAGQLAAEYDGSPAALTCTTCYLMDDHLGSTRMMSDGAAITDLHDYLPFGEEIAAGIGSRDGTWGGAEPKLKFTGKLRDDVAESGLDYFGARYFSSAQGRFTSPDAPLVGQNPSNPQSWNLYSYGLNNPLRYNDPTGHDAEEPDPGDSDKAPCGVNMKDCGPSIATGVYGSADGRWSLFADPTRLKLAREGADKTLGPEFDAITFGPVLGKALQLALGAAAKRLGLEVAADLGIAVNRAGIGEALADEARVLHAGRHLAEEGLVEGGTNAAVAAGTRTIVSEVLNHPITSFITRIGAGEGEVPVRLFVGQVQGKLVGVALADQAVGSVAKGGLVTIKILSH